MEISGGNTIILRNLLSFKGHGTNVFSYYSDLALVSTVNFKNYKNQSVCKIQRKNIRS